MSRTIIGIDIRVLVLGKRTGVEEYLLNLLPRMVAMRPDITFRLFYSAVRKQKLDYLWLRAPNVELCEFSLPNRLFLFPAHALFRWPKVDRLIGGCDVFWSPHIVNVALSPKVRHVVSVHDLAFERHPEFFSKEKLWWHRYLMSPRKQLHGADHIIAVSNSTKSDLQSLYHIPENKVSVVHPGVGSEYKPVSADLDSRLRGNDIKKKYNLPEHFILYFGTIEPRKNIVGLIQAFELLKKQEMNILRADPPVSGEVEKFSLRNSSGSGILTTGRQARTISLVIAGANGWLYKEVFETAKKSPYANDIIFTGFIADEDKPALYNLADVFVYPSFFEGFGFPPLEAMACGTPVVTSNRSSLPEVVGDAAILVDPWRPAEIARAIEILLDDTAAREALTHRGIERAKSFSWNDCAIKILKILCA